ncbi:MAG: hypothetical protein F6K34_20450 [Okeania sp. SIO4D6]|nr:hypothetical protein [Okeania sp. SIO4D6]
MTVLAAPVNIYSVVLHGNGEDIYFLIFPTLPIPPSPQIPLHRRGSQESGGKRMRETFALG